MRNYLQLMFSRYFQGLNPLYCTKFSIKDFDLTLFSYNKLNCGYIQQKLPFPCSLLFSIVLKRLQSNETNYIAY